VLGIPSGRKAGFKAKYAQHTSDAGLRTTLCTIKDVIMRIGYDPMDPYAEKLERQKDSVGKYLSMRYQFRCN
jgi:hypothetical protein